MDTDVNGSALGEQKWGAGNGFSDFVYITIGTGIGGGAIVNGNLVHGFNHNEIGHIQVSQLPGDDFRGVCPFHGNCFEGLASGVAIQERWGVPAHTLPVDHPAWKVEGETIARGLASLLAVLAPQRFILGGGVMQQGQLFPMIRRELTRLDQGYLLHGWSESSLADYIVPPSLGPRSGIMGAAILAQQVLARR
jgi:fructokinase